MISGCFARIWLLLHVDILLDVLVAVDNQLRLYWRQVWRCDEAYKLRDTRLQDYCLRWNRVAKRRGGEEEVGRLGALRSFCGSLLGDRRIDKVQERVIGEISVRARLDKRYSNQK